jgi:arylsulfatase
MEAIGLEWPETFRGHEQRPVEGTSLLYTLQDAKVATRKDRQYFEMFAHRAIWADGWKAVTLHWSSAMLMRLGHIDHALHDGDYDADTWELYHLDEDISEMHDLAAEYPDKLRELVDMWWEDAERYQVLPLDDSLLARLLVDRPRVFETREVYNYASRLRLPRQGSPVLRDRSFTISAEIEITDACEGTVMSYGGVDGGVTLCVVDGKVHFVSNFLGRTHTVVSSRQPVPQGPLTIDVLFERTAPNAAHVSLYLDGALDGEADVPRTNPVAFAMSEGLEVGTDSVSPVWPRYRSPFPFTGTIKNVVLTTPAPDEPLTPELARAEHRMAMLRQ